MYYQVLIETSEKVGKHGSNKQYFELDKPDLNPIITRAILPYLRKEIFQFDGNFLNPNEIRKISIKTTSKSMTDLSNYENETLPSNVVMYISPSDIFSYDRHTKDITNEVFDSAKLLLDVPNPSGNAKKDIDKQKIFIVHGRDDLAKIEVARFVEKLGLSAIILHEQASSGKTIIEKIEANTNVGFAIVLYTPCDFGGLNGEESQRKRARQNVVFEHGFLIGKLGRHNVCALVKGDVETPNDISGIVYIGHDANGAWNIAVAKELRDAGYEIDLNKAF